MFYLRSIVQYLFIGIVICFSLPTLAIQDGDYRIGLLAGNMEQSGTLKNVGSVLGYGLGFGYMFADTMLFQLEAMSGSSKEFSQMQVNLGVSYYYGHIGTAYFDLSGGMNVVFNNVTFSTNEKIAGEASGIYLGLGLDYDMSANFTTGFKVRYTYLKPAKKFDSTLTTEVPVLDSVIMTFFGISYVF